MATAGRSRSVFARDETQAFLAIISELNISELLDSRRQRNQVHFERVQKEMEVLGYKWTWQQLRTHWKNLKSRYNKERAAQEKSGAAPSTWTWFSEMNALLAHRPMVEARDYGIDSNAEYPDDSQGGRSEPEDESNLENQGFSCSIESSSLSFAQPRSRSRRSRNVELGELLAEQHRRNAEQLQQHADRMFQQQKELLEEERQHMERVVSGISTSYLQGMQLVLNQMNMQSRPFAFQPPQPFTPPATQAAPGQGNFFQCPNVAAQSPRNVTEQQQQNHN
ncbi:uncharacterized protein LOC135372415 [Ornithodoros turicata]|uniref:uncharacterized protein LOC135372415 n=1 Tax=Ornithodoros turicata TaxID=34597 RepID=UPI0031397552